MEATHWRLPTVRALIALAWPMILGRAAQSVVGFTDAVMVAPLGPDALAATGNGALNAFAVFMLPLGVVFIVQSFAAQLSGRHDPARLRRYGWYGLGVALLSELVALALIPAVPWLLARADYTPAVGALMSDYIALRLVGVGAAVGIEAIANWFGGQGDTRVGLAASVLVMVLNVPLAWVLIHGLGPVPAMGVRGAALASIVATLAGFAYALGAFAAAGGGVDRPGWRWEEFRRVLRFGLPNGVNWFLEFAAFLFFIDVVFAGMGTAALAALMAVLQLNSIAFMPAFGLANAGAIHVGQAIGADSADSVRRPGPPHPPGRRGVDGASSAWATRSPPGCCWRPSLRAASPSGRPSSRWRSRCCGWRWRGSSSTPSRWSTARRCARRATPRGPCGCASRSPGGPSSR
jgi:MATE family multidrug resistance protein